MNDDLPPWSNPGLAPWNSQPPLQICKDIRSDCAGKEMYCHGGSADWMNKNCKKTCGKCLSGKQYVFCHSQFSSVIQNIKNHCAILTLVWLC